MRMISGNGRVAEILHITIWAGEGVPLFSKMAKCASRGALRTSAKCANAPQKERLPPTRQQPYTRACKCGVFFNAALFSNHEQPSKYGSIQVVREGYCDVTPMSCCSWKS